MQAKNFNFVAVILGLVSLASVDTTMAQDLPLRPIAGSGGALAIPLAATANPQAHALPIQQLWTLQAGETIGQSLRAWAEKAQWNVVWSLPRDWVVPSSATFSGAFPDAAESVIKTLAANGALVRAQIYEGNKTIVIVGPGAAQQ